MFTSFIALMLFKTSLTASRFYARTSQQPAKIMQIVPNVLFMVMRRIKQFSSLSHEESDKF
jgi:hypothetical protein